MSRVIKFRARLLENEGDKTKGEWVYGLPQQRVETRGVVNLNKPAEIGYIVSYEPERMLQSGAPDDSLYWYEIDPQTLGQFTGRHDKHGKEVYEDDIVRARLAQNPGEAIEEVTEVVNIYEGLLAPFFMRVNWEEDWWTDALVDGFEVIGNAYEHPELVPK